MDNRILITTHDGSHSILEKNLNAHFHSVYGAIAESKHIYIDYGLKEAIKDRQELRIFEMGFGTGLNAFLSFLYAKDLNVRIRYTAIESKPLEMEIASKLNFPDLLNQKSLQVSFIDFHNCDWNSVINLTNSFQLLKITGEWESFHTNETYDLIYYDAFGPEVQAQLWSLDTFRKLYLMMAKDGILVTYCAKGQVKRDMRNAGFIVESLPGPIGKREITRARK